MTAEKGQTLAAGQVAEADGEEVSGRGGKGGVGVGFGHEYRLGVMWS